MTSALAAALRELDLSREALEKELAGNEKFVAFRRLEQAQPTPQGAEQRRDLITQLQQLPVFRAWQAITSSRAVLQGGPGQTAAVAQEASPAGFSGRTEQWSRGLSVSRPPADLEFSGPRRFSPPPGPPQALTAIRGLPSAIAQKLQGMGIQRYEQIAAWTAADVRFIRETLDLGREVSRRNWIEQAARLAARTAVAPASDKVADVSRVAAAVPAAVAPVAVVPAAVVAPIVAAPIVAAGAVAPVAVEPNESALPPLVEILPVEATVKPIAAPQTLATKPETTRAAAANATAAALAAIGRARVRAEAAPAAPPAAVTQPSPQPSVHAVISPPSPPLQAEAQPPLRRPLPRPATPAELSSRAVTETAPTHEPAPSLSAGSADDLGRIANVDTAMAARLAAAGVQGFAAIANWRRRDVDGMAATLQINARRICREGWIEQAAILATGKSTQHAQRLASGDLEALRPAPPAPPAVSEPTAEPETPTLFDRQETAEALPQPEPQARETPSPLQPTPPFPAQRSLARRVEEVLDYRADLRAAEPSEAVVTVLRNTNVRPDAAPPHSLVVAAEAAVATPVERRQSLSPLDPLTAPDRWAAPATSEEALVEIVRKDEAPGDVPTYAAIDRLRVRTSPPVSPVHTRDPQPIWRADRDAHASGVMRRFLRALKRDG